MSQVGVNAMVELFELVPTGRSEIFSYTLRAENGDHASMIE